MTCEVRRTLGRQGGAESASLRGAPWGWTAEHSVFSMMSVAVVHDVS